MSDPKKELEELLSLVQLTLSDPTEEGNCLRCKEAIVLECMEEDHPLCNSCAQEATLIFAKAISEYADDGTRFSSKRKKSVNR